ncbi:MAG: hypothetical protein IKE74_04750 [Mogibacterium sp.]|nr:hypothetical protein [Mogibacterium sp.]
MTKEIGGYMEIEQLRGRELYGDLLRFNLGRTAFLWLLERLPHRRVFIPEYICDSVPNIAESAGYDVVRYALDESLRPVWNGADAPSDSDILYLVSYYGQLTADEILRYHEAYPMLIVDNAQAFFDAPADLPGVYTIYTARKFFGLSDGAYLAADIASDYDSLERDRSVGRISYLAGRLEDSARDHYSEMLDVSSDFSSETPKKMSLFTENMLRGIDYDHVCEQRRSNYRELSRLLPGCNPFTKVFPSAPFAYPYHHPDGVALRKHLAERNIFVPTNWSYLLNGSPEDSLLHEWSANILPLPVDQRYGPEEMRAIAEAVRSF